MRVADTDRLLAEQVGHYRAYTPDYVDGVLPWAAAADELQAAIERFRPSGEVLELACGPGTWTPHLTVKGLTQRVGSRRVASCCRRAASVVKRTMLRSSSSLNSS